MAAASELQTELAKIRPHVSSSLPHQKAPAQLLIAVENTIKEQNTEPTPAAYFAALLTTLESTVKAQNVSFGEADLLPAELYLLAFVTPYVSSPVLRANVNTLLNLTAPLWPSLTAHAPPLRSQLTLYTALLKALDRSQLESTAIRQSFASVLQLCLDGRPKVRKKAAELVRDVLASSPTPLSRHPYGDRVAEWTLSALAEVNAGGIGQKKGKKPVADTAGAGIHLLVFIRSIILYLPPSALPDLTAALLTLPRLGNEYLSQSAYFALAELLSAPADEALPSPSSSLPEILKAVLASPPMKTDKTLLPAWARVLGAILTAQYAVEPEAAGREIHTVWKVLFPLLESQDKAVRDEAAEALQRVIQCISPDMMKGSLTSSGGKTHTLSQIIAQLTKTLTSLAYAHAVPHILSTISALFIQLVYRPGGRGTPTVAESLLVPLATHIANLRTSEAFAHKERADDVLRSALAVLGPDVLFRTLPLNLEPADRAAGRTPRAFLLPLLATPHPAPLHHFVSEMVPMSERMFELQQKAEEGGRAAEAKVWAVLIAQIWAGLPSYCYARADTRETLKPQFAQLLSQLLYTQAELRPAVLKALKVLVESNVHVAAGTAKDDPLCPIEVISQEGATANVAFLRSQAESWFAVLFNVFSTAGRNAQGMVGGVISAWADIADEKEMSKTSVKVMNLLKQNLNKPSANAATALAAAQDIAVLLVPHMPRTDAQALAETCLSRVALAHADGAVQKRAYKLLARIIESGKVDVDAEKVLAVLEDVGNEVNVSAKKDRLSLLKAVVPHVPPTSLHLIPSLIPEAVLGTKEPSEKARNAAFELIVAMGRKMSEGGTVSRSKLSEMDEDDKMEAVASIQEYMTMVAGGLAGATPHMISATITAIARLVFEFKDSISPQMHTDILSTIVVYLGSANREIVKSALGFVKLAVHTLPEDFVRPQLKTLVGTLLTRAHDHKNHFKEKVRHIFERMIRRYGWDAVYACADQDDDATKVLLNIKKRKDRAKRKKAQHDADEDEEDEAPKAKTGDAFDDVLYGSESEGEESDEEDAPQQAKGGKKKGKDSGARIRMDGDEPMDLLGGGTKLVAGNAKGRRKPGQDAAKFKTDEDTGKMLIDEDSDENEAAVEQGDDVAGAAYRESLTSVDGFTRGAGGRVKFHKDTKKRRRENDDGSDVEMADATGASAGEKRKAKKRSPVKLGREFKAKNAGGDVKRGGHDPYAYLPLSQAAKKGAKGRDRITVTGRR